MTEAAAGLIQDPKAFRSVFASPEESLVLVLSSGDSEGDLIQAVQETHRLRNAGVPLRLLIAGDSSAALSEAAVDLESIAGFLEPWAFSLLGPALTLADVIIPLGEEAERWMAEAGEGVPRKPAVLRPPLTAQSIRSALAGIGSGEKATPVDSVRLVLQNDWGIGDELLLSAVAREIARAFPAAELWIRSRYGFRFPAHVRRDAPPPEARSVDTIYQNPTLYGPGAHSPFPGHLVQQMLDKVALDTGLKVRATDVRPELELQKNAKRIQRTVLLHTGTNPRLPSKDWGVDRWRRLADLLRDSDVRLRQVGDRGEPLLPGVEDLRGVPPGELAEIFSESSAVVCVVGFLMHLAEATRTPAVVIYGGREHPAIDGYPDQIHLSSGPLPCRGRWGCHLGPDLDCAHEMRCMEAIIPELVASEVLSVLARGESR